jgi:hypothetical protein
MIAQWRVEDVIEHRTDRTAVDDLEPISASPPEDLRGAAQRYTAILEAFANRVESGIAEESLKSVKVNFWGAAYGLGLRCCDGMTMTERSLAIGVQRATISKQARAFIEANDLPPSWYMKTEADSYVTSRLAQVAASNGSNGNGTSE